jgi:pyruvate dehydrogenase E1 component alpha subunit
VCKGKGGMFTLHATEHRYWGGGALSGGQTPLACGLAFGLKHQEQRGCVFCFIGDGAMNQGAVHEAMNLAALFRLPVVFVIENNGFAMGMSQARSSAIGVCLAARADGYAMHWERADADDLEDMRARFAALAQRARDQHEPTVIEVRTYRWKGWSISDPNQHVYRPKAQVMEHIEHHDPIKLWGQRLMERGLATAVDLALMDKAALREARASVEFAQASPVLPVDAMQQDIFWELDHGTPRGRLLF